MRFKIVYSILILFFIRTFSADGIQIDQDPVKIGFLIQDNSSADAVLAAELAIRLANEKAGLKDRKFQLVTRSMKGPWGTGSKEAVSLIFNEHVFAIIGSHDGRNAHLVEQVCAKAHITFLSAMASDPTLSQAFVPWFFNCVPNDLQQSSILIKEIYQKDKSQKVAIVSDSTYDSRMAVRSFLKIIKKEGIKEPLLYSSDNSKNNIRNLVVRINKENPACIVISCKSDFSPEFVRSMRWNKMNQILFGFLFSIDENILPLQESRIVPVSSGFLLTSPGQTFSKIYVKVTKKKPSETAAYAFDAVNLMIEAIRKANYNPDHIRTQMSEINFAGVTGLIRFDAMGNRIEPASLQKSSGELQSCKEKEPGKRK